MGEERTRPGPGAATGRTQVPAAWRKIVGTRGLDLAGHPVRKAGMGAITMTVVSDPPSTTVVLGGEIDIATAPAVRRFLMAAISGGDVHLAVDMSGVTFIGAAGIGVLVAAANRAREAGGSLSLLAPSRQVRRLLNVLHLDAILPAARVAPSLLAAWPDASPGPAARTRDALVSRRHPPRARVRASVPGLPEPGPVSAQVSWRG